MGFDLCREIRIKVISYLKAKKVPTVLLMPITDRQLIEKRDTLAIRQVITYLIFLSSQPAWPMRLCRINQNTSKTVKRIAMYTPV